MPELSALSYAFVFCLFCLFIVWRYRRLKVITVVDGDTFVVVNTRGKRMRVRLRSVDCPEITQTKGNDAKRFSKDWLGSGWHWFSYHGRDKYRRGLVSVSVPGKGRLDAALVEAGLAYPLKGSFLLQFSLFKAKLARRGVWGQFIRSAPWEHRNSFRLGYKLTRAWKTWKKFSGRPGRGR